MTGFRGFLAVAPSLDGWTDDPQARDAVRLDRSGWEPDGRPVGVVRPRDVAGVQAAVAAANEHGVPVVPRGAGTGLAGGAAAGDGTLVLDLSGLAAIRAIDATDRVAVVEPGVVTRDLDLAAGAVGLRFAPDPASAELSTVGGNIATNAGGMRCVKHGVTRDAVLGLDVVLADGRLLRTGRRTTKGVAGYDLTSLFVGSEGTLGVVVGATLRLLPLPAPGDRATAAAHFATVEDAARAANAVQVTPSLLELLDAATLRAIDAGYGTGLADDSGALLIAQAEGLAADREIAAIAKTLADHGGRVTIAGGEDEADRLVAARRLALPAIEAVARPLIEDVAVPRSALAAAVRGVERIADETGVPIYTFAHAGDGTLHPIVAAPRDLAEIPPAVQRAADRVFRLALELGGTITAEHGVGALKRDWLRREIGEDAYRLHHLLKDALDPRGILNPGKAF